MLSADQDPFFSSNLYDNFGDLGASIKRYVLDYQARTASSSSIDTIADMKKFVEEYPEFRKLGGNVSKHVALVGELSRRVEKDRLLEVSELEQSLASNESHASDLRVRATLPSPSSSHSTPPSLAHPVDFSTRAFKRCYQTQTSNRKPNSDSRSFMHYGTKSIREIRLRMSSISC